MDGYVNDIRLIPVDLRVSNSMPLRIGGKGVWRGNDQFNGAVDNVYVAVAQTPVGAPGTGAPTGP
ncbi:hypothetical protein ACFQX7_21575 [Luedemannella flava]